VVVVVEIGVNVLLLLLLLLRRESISISFGMTATGDTIRQPLFVVDGSIPTFEEDDV
jgi:hypothetical protein